MSALRLSLRAGPPQRLDLSPLIPDRLAGLSEVEIARLSLATTRESVSVGDVFALHMGDAAEIVIEGGSPCFGQVGAGMTRGTLRLEGEAGPYAGRGMRGGYLAIGGNAGAFAASGLRGGAVVIEGDSGPSLAAPGPGERAGMAGGSVVVRGNAGPGAASRLRRGIVVIEGDAGPSAAQAMIAGTLVVCGRLSGPACRFMRRGTLLLAQPVALGAGFVPAGAAGDVFLRLLARGLEPLSPGGAALAARPLRRLMGDLAVAGQGEILLALPHESESGAKRP